MAKKEIVKKVQKKSKGRKYSRGGNHRKRGSFFARFVALFAMKTVLKDCL